VTAPRPDRPRWWQWPTILSLDAPAIILAWQAIVADAAGVPLAWPERFVLAASVWLAYTVDRWIEAWRLDETAIQTPRHRFHQQWRWPVAIAAGLTLAADVSVAVTRLDAPDLMFGTLLTAAVLTYLLSHQWLHRHAPWRVPKEVCVAVLLTAGVWLFLRDATGWRLWAPLGLFGLLCLANTALISRWEADVDRRHGQSSLALQSSRAARWIAWLPVVTLTAAIATLVVGPADARVPASCTAGCALLFVAIDRVQPRVGWPLARVLSDLALAAPLVVLVLR
jgi:hypothetical protein